MFSFLPKKVKNLISKLDADKLNEIRIRQNSPVVVYFDGKTQIFDNVKVTKQEIEEIVLSACNRSIYSYDEHIKKGFVTTDKGVRIGLSGEIVKDKDKIISIKNYKSLCIRIPNEINGVSGEFFNKVYKDGSVLVVSPSGVGKTTFIRDLSKNISNYYKENVVVIDERNEIASANNDSCFDLGDFTDVLIYADKSFGFNQAIRSLNPKFIITDELFSFSDVSGLINAVYSGCNVIATVHANSLHDAYSREFLEKYKDFKVFNYYVVITLENGRRKFSYFDRNFNKICF